MINCIKQKNIETSNSALLIDAGIVEAISFQNRMTLMLFNRYLSSFLFLYFPGRSK